MPRKTSIKPANEPAEAISRHLGARAVAAIDDHACSSQAVGARDGLPDPHARAGNDGNLPIEA